MKCDKVRLSYIAGELHRYIEAPVQMYETMKHAVLWYVTPCGSCKNGRFGGTYRLHHQGDKNQLARNYVRSN
jgi:hypothetical protein